MSFVNRAWRVGLSVALLTVMVASPAAAGAQVERPYKTMEVGTFASTDPSCTDFFGAGCPFTTQSTGTQTHLGQTSAYSEGTLRLRFPVEGCLLLDGATQGIVFESSGTVTFTAANGDQLFGTFENEGCTNPDPATSAIGTAIEGSQTITGGTGRFEGAGGSTTTVGHGFGDDFDLVATGTLTY